MRLLFFFLIILSSCASRLPAQRGPAFSRQDTLRGSNGRGRDWWDVRTYDLAISVHPETKSLYGTVDIAFNVPNSARDSMQIDLQVGMELDNAVMNGQTLRFHKDGNVWWLNIPKTVERDRQFILNKFTNQLLLTFHGTPVEARLPPWDGGLIWGKDSLGSTWTAVACQGLGASSWWPCKDFQGDEPDDGMTVKFTSAGSQTIVSNGRYKSIADTVKQLNPITGEEKSSVTQDTAWAIKNPINTYDVSFYIGDYAHWSDTFRGEKGVLSLDFYPLKYNESKARKHWREAKTMLRCFEHWMGPYPFYEDGYKLVEAPYLGMEHQSAVAYGNQYRMGYLGRDLSGTGEGMKFDFITIHESGHEWFGNNITAKDVADNWIHEGITTYTEVLYLEWIESKKSAFRYMQGRHKGIENKEPVIGPYGVHAEGADIYEKGAAVIHMVRLMMANEEKFRGLLRGLNKEFYHKTVTTGEVEAYISKAANRNLKPFFDLYLRSTVVPELRITRSGRVSRLKLINVPGDFVLPLCNAEGKFFANLSGTETILPENISSKELTAALADYLIVFQKN